MQKNSEIVSVTPLIEWLAQTQAETGSVIEIISDHTPETTQFCRAFGGVGAFLRFAHTFQPIALDDDDEDGFMA
jgi:peptide subunit release factor 1 (eRF1)